MLRRRSLLLGVSATTLTPGIDPLDRDWLTLSLQDGGERELVIDWAGAAPLIVWTPKLFGPNATFTLERSSAPLLVKGVLLPPNAIHEDRLEWVPVTWTLTIDWASFPDRGDHSLVLVFARAPDPKLPQFGSWTASLTINDWPRQSQRWTSQTPLAEHFLNGAATLASNLPQAAAQAGLEQWFGQRVQTTEALQIDIDETGGWRATAAENRIFILDVGSAAAFNPFGFAELRVERVFEAAPFAELPSGPAGPTRQLQEFAPRTAGRNGSVGLSGSFDRVKETVPPSRAIELAEVDGNSVTRLRLELSASCGLRGAVRHWGEPDATVARAWSDEGETEQARLVAEGTAGQQSSRLASFRITRQLHADRLVHTHSSVAPCAKEQTVATPFGQLCLQAAADVPPWPGASARSPPIRVRTTDRPQVKDPRTLVEFDAVFSLMSLSIHLPSLTEPERESGREVLPHVARLDFKAAECRFVLAGLRDQCAVAADALFPLGSGPRDAIGVAIVDLNRADLSVLRPADLLSLKYNFSGLLLEMPAQPTEARARVLPSRGSPFCRGGSMENTLAVRDQRPIMVVEFRPQHVAERAYLRQQPVLDLPALAVAKLETLFQLRMLQSLDRASDTDGTRKTRIVLRQELRRGFGTDNELVNTFEKTSAGLQAELRGYPAGVTNETRAVLEATKERANGDYAEFRRAFEKQCRTVYLGSEWLAEQNNKGWTAFAEAWYRSRTEPVDAIVESRSSGPSRLAFCINCDDYEAERAGGGFAFSLEALTNWNLMDLSVVRRAERLFAPPVKPAFAILSGPVPPRWGWVPDLDDAAILRHQRIGRGDHLAVKQDRLLRGAVPNQTPDEIAAVTESGLAGQIDPFVRLAQIAAETQDRPDPFQTAIELPFRLFLSPAQDAIWRVPNEAVRRKTFSQVPALVDPCQELWSASLMKTGMQAGLRAVWLPDYRPSALFSRRGGPGAPPHGLFAPWALPKTCAARRRPKLKQTIVKKAAGLFCPDPAPESVLPMFRTSLDAYDRHELILSSVHGPPSSTPPAPLATTDAYERSDDGESMQAAGTGSVYAPKSSLRRTRALGDRVHQHARHRQLALPDQARLY